MQSLAPVQYLIEHANRDAGQWRAWGMRLKGLE
jgi:hypothetical protein